MIIHESSWLRLVIMPRNEIGPVSPAECLAGFDPGSFWFGRKALTHQATLGIVSRNKEMKKNNENVTKMISVGDIPRRVVKVVGYGNEIWN